MHRFPSKSSILRFRIGALLFILRFLLPMVGLPLLLWSMLMDDHPRFLASVVLLAAYPPVVIAQWIVGAKVRCPLCLAPPLLQRGCAKNRKAWKLLGSYRLRVSVASLFRSCFRCQYCGEPSEMKARERPRMDED